MEKYFLEYASYVIIDRAIPDLRDGCKPVQRRILHTLFEIHDGKFHKVANVIGETMKLHPHGETSIGDALVVLASKEYLIQRQGNFGNILTGHGAAAPRYIECRLTPLALETLFNKSLTRYIPSYDGRKKEPQLLPVKIPVLLMLGTEGIAVGMSTRILSHNFIELLDAQIALLNKKKITVYPDFPQGGLIDVSEYDDGAGKVRIRAVLEKIDDKKLIIREIPHSTTTSSLINSIEAAIQRGKVNIASINDFTTDKVEIELTTSRGFSSEDVIPQLYAYTDCEVSISSNLVVIRENHPAEITVSEYLKEFTSILRNQIQAELEFELKNLEDRKHWLTLEQIFIENRVYKRIESAKTESQVKNQVITGMKAFSHLFIREMTDEDVQRLLEIRIRRISAFDIEKNRHDIDNIIAAIRVCHDKLKSLTKTTIGYLEDLKQRYGAQYPRRSKITTFEAIDKKAVAKADIKLYFDRETGFFGASVKNQDYFLTVTEYDRILVISGDGTYRIIAPPDKILLPQKLLYCKRFEPDKGVKVTFAYRDSKKIAWGKKVHITKFITDKVYDLCKSSSSGIEFFSIKKNAGQIKLIFVSAPRQKVKEVLVDLNTLKICGLTARGTRLHAKPVRRIVASGRA